MSDCSTPAQDSVIPPPGSGTRARAAGLAAPEVEALAADLAGAYAQLESLRTELEAEREAHARLQERLKRAEGIAEGQSRSMTMMLNALDAQARALAVVTARAPAAALPPARPVPPPAPPVAVLVYFVQAGDYGPIKIGCSRNPWARVHELQTGNPEPLNLLVTIPGGAEEEQRLHARFAHLRLTGEWFASGEELYSFLRPLIARDLARTTS